MNPTDFFAKYGVAQNIAQGTGAGVMHTQPTKSKGNILTRNLNTGGQIGGGLAGAAAGTAIAPGIGTLLGGLIGAFGGGAGGEAAKRAALGEQQNLGESLKQGAIGAGNEAVGQGVAGLLGKIVGRGAGDALATGASDSGLINKAGNSLRQGVMNPIVKASPTGAATEADITANANKLLPIGSANAKYTAMPRTLSKLGSQLDTVLASNTATVPAHELTDVLSQTLGDATKFPTTDTGFVKAADQHLSNILEAGTQNGGELTAQNVADMRRGLQDVAFKPGAVTPQKEAAQAIWSQLGDTLQQMAPEAKSIISQQGDLYKAAPGLQKAAAKSIGVPMLGVKSKLAERVVQSATDRAGSILGGTAGVTDKAASNGLISKIAPVAARAVPKGIESILNPPQQGTAVPTATDGAPTDDTDQSATSASQDVFTPQVLQSLALNDIATTGGKNLSQIATLSSLFGPGGKANGDQTLTATQQKVSDSANAASSTLDTMLEQLTSNGGSQGRLGGAVSGLLGKVGLNDTVSAYNKTKTDAAISLAQALSGSTRVPPPSTLKLLEDSMPSYTDNPKEAALKVQDIKQRLNAKLQSAGIQ